MVIYNDESLLTHDVWLQGLKQLAFHTETHSNVLSTDENSTDLDGSKGGSITFKLHGETCRFFF
jgi:hypothetical protein